MDTRVKTVIRHICLFAVLMAVLYLFLVLCSAVPNDAIKDNMLTSAYDFKDVEAYSFSPDGRLNGISDNYADSVLLNVAYNMGRGNPFVSSVDTKYFKGGEYGINYGLYQTLAEDVAADTDYTRYWHGTAGIVRVVHLFADVSTVKAIGFALAVLLALIVLFMLIKSKQYIVATAFAVALVSVNIWNIRLSMEYQSAFVICFALCMLFIIVEKKKENFLTYIALAGGTLTAFFDFLTCETVVITLPLVLLIGVRMNDGRISSFKEELWIIVKCVAVFFVSYFGAFVLKWILATVITGENKFVMALSSAGEHITGDSFKFAPRNIFVRIPMSILANLTAIFGGSERANVYPGIVGLVICIFAVVTVVYLFARKPENTSVLWLMAILAALPFVRYVLLSSHSFIHCFFTHRALASTVAALIIIVATCIKIPGKGKQVKR